MLGCGSLHTLCPVGGVIPWVHVRESAGVRVPPAHTVPSGRGIPWVHVRESAGVRVPPAHTVPSGRGIPWVHVRESAGVWVPAHTVPSGRGYTMGAREGECWGVGPCTHCFQWEGLYHGCT